MELRIRRRNRLKAKESRRLRSELSQEFGDLDLWPDEAAVEVGELPDLHAIVVDNEVRGLRLDGRPFLSVRGLLAYRPATRYVTVDMGAIRFVHNGADVMAPGIVDADPDLEPGDWCWIRDERNRQPLAVGECRMTGPEMAQAKKGKAVRSIHFLGDKIWELDT